MKVVTPSVVPMMPPLNSTEASAGSIARRRQQDGAPENDEAAMWLAAEATATPGRDADEDQERGHQEAVADAEHAGDKADRGPNRQQQEDVDRDVGDREVDLHALLLLVLLGPS